MTVLNTLAYSNAKLLTSVKSFIEQPDSEKLIKLDVVSAEAAGQIL
jgi:hypothetical protein